MANIFKKTFERKVPKEARHNFIVEIIYYFFLGISNGFILPFFLVVARKNLGATPFWIGIMIAATGVGMILAFLTTGLIKQNKELKAYILFSIIGRIGNILLAFSINAPMFAMLVFLSSSFQALPQPQYGIIVQKIYPTYCRATLVSYTRIVTNATTLLFTFVGGYLMDAIGWRNVFILSALAIVLATITCFWYRIPEVEYERTNISLKDYLKYGMKLLKTDLLNRNIIIGAFIFVLGIQIYSIIFPIMQSDVVKLTSTQMGWLNGISSVTTFLSLFYFGPFMDKKGSVGGLVLSFLLFIPVPIIYTFAHNWTDLILAFVIHGIYTGCNTIAYFNMIIDLSPKGEEQIYQGVNSFWTGIRAFVGIIIATFFVNKILAVNANNNNTLLLLGSSICLLGVIFLHITCRKDYGIKRCE